MVKEIKLFYFNTKICLRDSNIKLIILWTKIHWNEFYYWVVFWKKLERTRNRIAFTRPQQKTLWIDSISYYSLCVDLFILCITLLRTLFNPNNFRIKKINFFHLNVWYVGQFKFYDFFVALHENIMKYNEYIIENVTQCFCFDRGAS